MHFSQRSAVQVLNVKIFIRHWRRPELLTHETSVHEGRVKKPRHLSNQYQARLHNQHLTNILLANKAPFYISNAYTLPITIATSNRSTDKNSPLLTKPTDERLYGVTMLHMCGFINEHGQAALMPIKTW